MISVKTTWTGRLVREDLGAGVWMLEADDGHRYQLAGAVPEEFAGRQVRVTGRKAGLFSFGMAGDSIQVESIRVR